MQRRLLLLATLGVPLLVMGCQKQAPVVELFIQSNGDLLEFKPTELSCPTGAHVRLMFFHAGKYLSLEHNWVLILPHTFDAVNKAALEAGEKNGWVPKGDKHILAATPLCGKGQAVVCEFIAPAPGRYPFICSNPGHAQSMWGVLNVTAA